MDRIHGLIGTSIVPWLALAGGAVAILVFAPRVLADLSRPADPFRGVKPIVKTHWRADLVGQKVALPEADSVGRKIPKGRSFLVVTLACSSCSSVESFRETLAAASVRPVIVCMDTITKTWAEGLGSQPEQIRLIEAKFGSGIVPDPMLLDAPQAALFRRKA